jgi:hypothetical protein
MPAMAIGLSGALGEGAAGGGGGGAELVSAGGGGVPLGDGGAGGGGGGCVSSTRTDYVAARQSMGPGSW